MKRTAAQRKHIRWWKEMLATTDIKQTRNNLNFNDKRCCLGLQCDIYATDVGGYWQEMNVFTEDVEPNIFSPDAFTYVTSLGIPSAKIRDYFGMTEGHVNCFASLNDNLRLNFKQIGQCVDWVLRQSETVLDEFDLRDVINTYERRRRIRKLRKLLQTECGI